MPMNRKLYPIDWEQISARIRHERAKDKCERCGVANHEIGARDCNGKWHTWEEIHGMSASEGDSLFEDFPTFIQIILTVAHLDQNPANNDESNLAALCQRCHLNHDRPFNMPKIKATWKRKHIEAIRATGQQELWR